MPTSRPRTYTHRRNVRPRPTAPPWDQTPIYPVAFVQVNGGGGMNLLVRYAPQVVVRTADPSKIEALKAGVWHPATTINVDANQIVFHFPVITTPALLFRSTEAGAIQFRNGGTSAAGNVLAPGEP